MCKYCDAFRAEALKEAASSSSPLSSADGGEHNASRQQRQRQSRRHHVRLTGESQQLRGPESQPWGQSPCGSYHDDDSGSSSFAAVAVSTNQNANSDAEYDRRRQQGYAPHAQHGVEAGSEVTQSESVVEGEYQQQQQQQQHQQQPKKGQQHQHLSHSKHCKSAATFCASCKCDEEDSSSQGAWSANVEWEVAGGDASIIDEAIGQLTGCLEDCEIIDLEDLLELPSEEIDFPPPHEDGDAVINNDKEGKTAVVPGATVEEDDERQQRRRRQHHPEKQRKTRRSRATQIAAGDEAPGQFDTEETSVSEKETEESEGEIEKKARGATDGEAEEAENESLYDCEPDNENVYFILPEI